MFFIIIGLCVIAFSVFYLRNRYKQGKLNPLIFLLPGVFLGVLVLSSICTYDVYIVKGTQQLRVTEYLDAPTSVALAIAATVLTFGIYLAITRQNKPDRKQGKNQVSGGGS